MQIQFYKYQGAGNDFIMIDNRHYNTALTQQQIELLCDRRFGVGADGLILLDECKEVDFKMTYYNADGNLGSMCGNGGRCVVAFAKMLGIINDQCVFSAYDGKHIAICEDNGLISLQMSDVTKVELVEGAWCLDTGSPHLVYFKEEVSEINVQEEGAKVRCSPLYKEKGVNVNFAAFKGGEMYMRTYERGVEAETLACGTGATAAAIAAYKSGLINETSIKINVMGGVLSVRFKEVDDTFKHVYLLGEAKLVYSGEIDV